MVTAALVVLVVFLVKIFDKVSATQPVFAAPAPSSPQEIHVHLNGIAGGTSTTVQAPSARSVLEEGTGDQKTAAQKLLERKERLKFDGPSIKNVQSNFQKAGKEIVSDA